MALYSYLQSVQRLLWDYRQELLRPADLTTYINMARNQIAGESESIRVMGTFSTVVSQAVYPFSSINTSVNPGVAGILNIRLISLTTGNATTLLDAQAWEWFFQYSLCQVAPAPGVPSVYAQYGQGVNGSIYLAPLPEGNYTANCDTVCYPITLVNDATVEAIPYPWTDAIPFYAAYLAFLSVQKLEPAAGMFALYEKYMRRARSFSTPSVLPDQYPQNTMLGRPSPTGQLPPQIAENTGAPFQPVSAGQKG